MPPRATRRTRPTRAHRGHAGGVKRAAPAAGSAQPEPRPRVEAARPLADLEEERGLRRGADGTDHRARAQRVADLHRDLTESAVHRVVARAVVEDDDATVRS